MFEDLIDGSKIRKWQKAFECLSVCRKQKNSAVINMFNSIANNHAVIVSCNFSSFQNMFAGLSKTEEIFS